MPTGDTVHIYHLCWKTEQILPLRNSMGITTATDPFIFKFLQSHGYWCLLTIAAPESFPAPPACPYKSPGNEVEASSGLCCCQLRPLQADLTTIPTIRARASTWVISVMGAWYHYEPPLLPAYPGVGLGKAATGEHTDRPSSHSYQCTCCSWRSLLWHCHCYMCVSETVPCIHVEASVAQTPVSGCHSECTTQSLALKLPNLVSTQHTQMVLVAIETNNCRAVDSVDPIYLRQWDIIHC